MGVSFGNALSGAASALTNAAAGNQAGIAAGNEQNTSNLLTTIQAYRQQAQDQLARQEAQSKIALEGAQGDEARARASATLQPVPKPITVMSPGQVGVGPDGKTVLQGPPAREDPSVARERIAAAAQAQHDAALAVQSGNQARAQAAKEYTDALNGYQQVTASNPSIKSPVATALTGWATGAPGDYTANEVQAKARVKAAWQAYRDSGGNPADRPEFGLVAPKGSVTPPATPTGTKPSAKDIVNAAINGHPLPE